MQSVYLKFYLTEKHHHHGKLLYEWLLEQGRAQGMPGGSVFRAIAGFGRHGHLHEETFFELGGELPVQVEFVLAEDAAEKLLATLREEQIKLPFVRYTVESGLT